MQNAVSTRKFEGLRLCHITLGVTEHLTDSDTSGSLFRKWHQKVFTNDVFYEALGIAMYGDSETPKVFALSAARSGLEPSPREPRNISPGKRSGGNSWGRITS